MAKRGKKGKKKDEKICTASKLGIVSGVVFLAITAFMVSAIMGWITLEIENIWYLYAYAAISAVAGIISLIFYAREYMKNSCKMW